MFFNMFLNGVMLKWFMEDNITIDLTRSFEFYRLNPSYQEFDIQQEMHENAMVYVVRHDALQIEEYGRTIEETLAGTITRLIGRIKTVQDKLEIIKTEKEVTLNPLDVIYQTAFVKSPLPFIVFFYPRITSTDSSGSSAAPHHISQPDPRSTLKHELPIENENEDEEVFRKGNDAMQYYIEKREAMMRSDLTLLKKIIDHMVDEI